MKIRNIAKQSFSLLLALMLMMGLTTTAFAADSSVTYEGGAEKFVFLPGSEHSGTDLFDNFKNVMPGDTLTQKIKVSNPKSHRYRTRIYLRSVGDIEGEEFLKQMTLKVTQEKDTDLFEAPSNETDGLTEWTLLGTLNPGADLDLNVELTVPIEMGNDFQNKLGKIEWQFRVEEIPISSGGGGDSDGGGGGGRRTPTEAITDPSVPLASPEIPTVSIGDNETPLVALPKLGDMGIGVYIIGLVLLLGVAGGALYARKRIGSKEQ